MFCEVGGVRLLTSRIAGKFPNLAAFVPLRLGSGHALREKIFLWLFQSKTCTEQDEVSKIENPKLMDRKRECESAAFPHLALHPDFTSMQFDKLLGQR